MTPPPSVRPLWTTVGGLASEQANAVNTAEYIPAPEVVTEIERSGLPIQAMSFLTAVSVETLLPGPAGGPLAWPYSWSVFRCEFGFTEWTGSLASFPLWGGNAQFNTHAFGVWQDEPDTYAGAAAKTGRPSVEPQDQIANNWVVAGAAFGVHTGGSDLLTTLTAAGTNVTALSAVTAALSATWPEGCDANFPARYTAALAMYQAGRPAPPMPPGPPTSDAISIPLGYQVSYPVSGTLAGEPEMVPADALTSNAPSVCSVAVADGTAVFSGLTLGTAVVTGGDLSIDVTVAVAKPDHLVIDFTHGTLSKIPASAPGSTVRSSVIPPFLPKETGG